MPAGGIRPVLARFLKATGGDQAQLDVRLDQHDAAFDAYVLAGFGDRGLGARGGRCRRREADGEDQQQAAQVLGVQFGFHLDSPVVPPVRRVAAMDGMV